jgi:PsbP-like protein
MFCKSQPFWILPSLVSLMMLSVIAFNVPIVRAQQDSTNFLTYTNTDLGFTIKYPSDWSVNDSKIVSEHSVGFFSPDRRGIVYVEIANETFDQTTIDAMNDSAKANAIRTNLSPNAKILELDVSRYYLSGHPAIRFIEIRSFGGAEQSMSSKPYDEKTMIYGLVIGGKLYKVGYTTLPQDFVTYLQTAQSMIDSFQIISKQ